MYKCYFKMERIHKKKNGEEYAVPKYITTYINGHYKPLDSLKKVNDNGSFEMFLIEPSISNNKSGTAMRLQCNYKGAINFSSVFLINSAIDGYIGYGTPQSSEWIEGKIRRENPFYRNRNDGYIFAISKDFENIECFIVEKGKGLIKQYAIDILQGKHNKEIIQLRANSRELLMRRYCV